MELTIKWYLEYLRTKQFSDINAQRDFKLMNKAIEQIGESNIEYFYVKNIFNKELEQEFYFFTKEKIVICKYTENNSYNLKVVYKVNVLSISFEEPLRDSESCKLLINFKDNTMISLESVKDSNTDWAYMYKDKIKTLFKALS